MLNRSLKSDISVHAELPTQADTFFFFFCNYSSVLQGTAFCQQPKTLCESQKIPLVIPPYLVIVLLVIP